MYHNAKSGVIVLPPTGWICIDNLQVFRLVLYIQSWKRHFEDMSKCFLWKWFNKNEWCVTLRFALKVWRLEKDSCNAPLHRHNSWWRYGVFLWPVLPHISENMAIAMIFSNLQTFLNHSHVTTQKQKAVNLYVVLFVMLHLVKAYGMWLSKSKGNSSKGLWWLWCCK